MDLIQTLKHRSFSEFSEAAANIRSSGSVGNNQSLTATHSPFVIPPSYKEMRRRSSKKVSLADEIMQNSKLPFYCYKHEEGTLRCSAEAEQVRQNQFAICLLADVKATECEKITGSGDNEFEEYDVHVGPIAKYIEFPQIHEIPSGFHQLENPKHGAFFEKKEKQDFPEDNGLESERKRSSQTLSTSTVHPLQGSGASISSRGTLKSEDLDGLSFVTAYEIFLTQSPSSETPLKSPGMDSDSEPRFFSPLASLSEIKF